MPNTPELWRSTQLVSTVDGATNLTNDQWDPKVIHLANGNILVVYTSNADVGAGNPSGNDIIGRLYDSQGNSIDNEFRLNAAVFGEDQQVEIAALPGGGFISVYEEVGLFTNVTSIRLQEFDADGNLVSSSTTAVSDGNAATPNYSNPNISVSSANLVLVTYEVDNGNNDVDVAGRLYNPQTNTYFPEFTIFDGGAGNGEGVEGHSVATLNNGAFVVTWADQDGPVGDDDDIQFSLVTIAGAGPVETVSDSFEDASDPHVVGLSGDGFVITWVADNSGGTNTGIRARVYNDSGNSLTPVFTPASSLAGNQLAPVAAALQDGGFVIVWLDAPTQDIHGQRFSADGSEVGGEFNIDTNVNLGPAGINIDIEGLEDGRFAITWDESPPSGGFAAFDTDVHMAIWDPRDQENSPNDYTTDQVVGTAGGDTINVAAADDQVYGWSGNDNFQFQSGEANSGDIFDGGTGNDRITIHGNGTVNFVGSTLTSFNEVEFDAVAGESKTAIFAASQLGGGSLASGLLVDGNAFGAGAPDTLQFNMGSSSTLDLSDLTFQQWQSSVDLIRVNGDFTSETIIGSSQRDEINGGGNNDTISGGGGNDVLIGGTGMDDLVGGTGTDTADYRNSGAAVQVRLWNGTGIGGEAQGDTLDSIENVVGSNNNDLLAGDSGANRLDGRSGGDTINAGGGNDVLIGGGGIDLLIGGTGADDLIGGNGIDTADYTDSSAGVTVRQWNGTGTGGDAEGDTLDSIENVTGSAFGDLLSGDSAANVLNGLQGNDTLNAGGGGDTLIGGTGMDTLLGGNGTDTADYRDSGAAVQVRLWNGTGIGGQAQGDTLDSIENVVGSNNNDLLAGDNAANRLDGRGGADTINAGNGNDTLIGGGGNDTLIGGNGNDTHIGGNGNDTFVFADGSGVNTITDFNADDAEDIDLSAITDITSFTDLVNNHLVNAGGTAQIVDGANSILLEGVAFGDVGLGLAYSTEDFVF